MHNTRTDLDALRAAFVVGLFGVTVSGAVGADVVAPSAWVAEPPPVDVPVAGYVTLRNEGRADVVITAISSPQFERVEAHETVVVDGVAKMRSAGTPVMPAGSTLQMRPGGRHLMLFGPGQPLQAGEIVTLRFEFDSAPPLEVRAAVRAAGEARGAGHDAHTHGTHDHASHDHGTHAHDNHGPMSHDHGSNGHDE